MKFKLPCKKYRCVCKFAWLPVIVQHQYVWLERYYKLQSWDRNDYEKRGIGWVTDEIITRDRYLKAKTDTYCVGILCSKYFNKLVEEEYDLC